MAVQNHEEFFIIDFMDDVKDEKSGSTNIKIREKTDKNEVVFNLVQRRKLQ